MKVNVNGNIINVLIEEKDDLNINEFKEYINRYNERKVIVSQDNELLQINLQDIILFYSDKKYNYCKTNI